MSEKIDNHSDVKLRLMDAGEELFADFGYDGTSTRQLTQKAGCNLAAVNYYFGGKHELYFEVIGRKMRYLRDKRLEKIGKVIADKGNSLKLEELLKVFAEAFVEPIIEAGGGRRFMKLFGWEMLNPKFPKQRLFDEMIKPVMKLMSTALKTVCPELPEQKAVWCITSIVAQLVHSIHMDILSGVKDEMVTSYNLQQRIEHIVEFSSAAIKGISEKYNANKK